MARPLAYTEFVHPKHSLLGSGSWLSDHANHVPIGSSLTSPSELIISYTLLPFMKRLTSVSFFLLANFLVLLTLIHSISITYSVFDKNFINNYFSSTYKYFINKMYGIYFTFNYA